MNSIEQARKSRLIKQAHAILDRIEANLKHIFATVEAEKSKKSA